MSTRLTMKDMQKMLIEIKEMQETLISIADYGAKLQVKNYQLKVTIMELEKDLNLSNEMLKQMRGLMK